MPSKHAIHVSEDIHVALKNRLKPGFSYNKVLEDLLSEEPSVDHISADVTQDVTLAAAADRILDALRPETKNRVYELCQTHQRSPEDYILSWCQLVEDQGNTTFALSEQQLEHTTDGRRRFEPPKTPDQKTCEFCGSVFKPKKHDNRFCPANPDSAEPSCGKKYHMAQIHGAVPRSPETLDQPTEDFMRKIATEPIRHRPADTPVPA